MLPPSCTWECKKTFCLQSKFQNFHHLTTIFNSENYLKSMHARRQFSAWNGLIYIFLIVLYSLVEKILSSPQWLIDSLAVQWEQKDPLLSLHVIATFLRPQMDLNNGHTNVHIKNSRHFYTLAVINFLNHNIFILSQIRMSKFFLRYLSCVKQVICMQTHFFCDYIVIGMAINPV